MTSLRFIEFDHHAGVFLTIVEPAKFHVHTIMRTPLAVPRSIKRAWFAAASRGNTFARQSVQDLPLAPT